jgi:hypothetical protein
MKYCWCDMCGYTATIKQEHAAKIEEQADCPLCKREGMFSILEIGDEIPEYIAEDYLDLIYPQTP